MQRPAAIAWMPCIQGLYRRKNDYGGTAPTLIVQDDIQEGAMDAQRPVVLHKS